LSSGEFSQRTQVSITLSTGTSSGGTTTFTDIVGFASGAALIEAQFQSTGAPPSQALERTVMAALKSQAQSS
jgi:hypothetical protein